MTTRPGPARLDPEAVRDIAGSYNVPLPGGDVDFVVRQLTDTRPAGSLRR